MIFKLPARTSGAAINAGIPMSIPARAGENELPMLRAMFVTPPAAERSSGSTTARV
jgi:hypothetical protein